MKYSYYTSVTILKSQDRNPALLSYPTLRPKWKTKGFCCKHIGTLWHWLAFFFFFNSRSHVLEDSILMRLISFNINLSRIQFLLQRWRNRSKKGGNVLFKVRLRSKKEYQTSQLFWDGIHWAYTERDFFLFSSLFIVQLSQRIEEVRNFKSFYVVSVGAMLNSCI